MAYILDTNTLADLWHHGETRVLGRRVASIPDPQNNRRITIITFEEMLGGRLLDLRRDPKNLPELRTLHLRYAALSKTFHELQKYYPPMSFDERAQAIYEMIPKSIRTITRSGDCKIAAIAVETNYVVITANTRDFERIRRAIPVKFEDWTVPPPA